MDIILYLEEILLQNKEVGITGLGTLYKKKFAGKYDKEQKSFVPPSFTLQFTPEVKNADILVSYIAEKRNISADSAQYFVDQFIEEINQKLELEHEAVLTNIGRLFYTEADGLSFEPAKKINYGSEFFGLPVLPEIHQEEVDQMANTESAVEDENIIVEEDKESTEILNNVTPIVEPIIENVDLDEVRDDLKNTLSHAESIPETIIETPEFIKEQHEAHPNQFGHQPEAEQELAKTYVNLEEDKQEELPASDVPEFIKEQHEEHPNRFGNDPLTTNEEEKPKSIWPKILIAILVLLIIAGLTYLYKPELFNSATKEKPSIAIIPNRTVIIPDTTKIKQDSIAKADSILKVNLVPNKADTSKLIANNSKKLETTFEVIGASFRTTKMAERFVKQMKGYGITAKIVPVEGPYKKVSIASFKTEQEALDARPALSKKVKIKELDIKQINTQP
ncbi:SPOR domain-containing protein [Pedobacter changchengzhani]|uniref:SPOR domain-containing protein n=1 Tax=Pedobacter changchengzhani TaxID=2529274 RepID=A0A4R5MLG1_9SPHI|nr:SPOR domain-containing protein [Pedobacter changchengzhani]TDG36306.1 SPOR domain-containing protein [Pedobacter changchengzhani]